MSWLVEHVRAILEAFTSVEPAWIALALAFQLGNLACRSTAWRNVLASAFPQDAPTVTGVGRAYAIGVGLNGWLPARGGDAAKIALVRGQLQHSNAVAITTSCTVLVVVDSLIGLTLLAIAGATGAVPLPSAHDLLARASSSLPLIAAVGAVLLVALAIASRRYASRIRSGFAHARQGLSILRSPLHWARSVLSIQLLAWSCRIGMAFCMLAAFSIPATPQLAALVVVVGGMSTLVPVPGGAGTQQALAAFVLAGVASTSHALAFSVGMQVGVTAVNTTIALLAAMWAFGHLHPMRALRAAAAAGRPATPVLPEPLPDAVG
ncbi:MAG: flippase-like domain-containing protein [Thermoleophilia bacterium]|nr:flippase-like domain-containing protein [Thermoleophilia bacterium]